MFAPQKAQIGHLRTLSACKAVSALLAPGWIQQYRCEFGYHRQMHVLVSSLYSRRMMFSSPAHIFAEQRRCKCRDSNCLTGVRLALSALSITTMIITTTAPTSYAQLKEGTLTSLAASAALPLSCIYTCHCLKKLLVAQRMQCTCRGTAGPHLHKVPAVHELS